MTNPLGLALTALKKRHAIDVALYAIQMVKLLGEGRAAHDVENRQRHVIFVPNGQRQRMGACLPAGWGRCG